MLTGCRRKSTGYQWLGSPQTFFWEHGDSADLGEPGYPIRRTANSHTSWTIEFGVNPRFFALLGSLFSQQVNFQCHYIRVAAKMIEKCLQDGICMISHIFHGFQLVFLLGVAIHIVSYYMVYMGVVLKVHVRAFNCQGRRVST